MICNIVEIFEFMINTSIEELIYHTSIKYQSIFGVCNIQILYFLFNDKNLYLLS